MYTTSLRTAFGYNVQHGICEIPFESTLKFASKVITKDKGYDELLDMANLSSVVNRRLYLKLCTLY